ncbi:MAG: 6-phosphofructokinase [Clostridia bacterium]|nr:6-phosphofructokinase [Clostridia bacterium]
MNIVVAQSGGPTAVINSSMLGVYRQALVEDTIGTVYGSLNGIEGIIYDRLVSLNDRIVTDEDMALVRQTPASALGSCRYKLPDAAKEPAVYESIRKTLESHDIGAFFYIGGNDSMDTVNKLSAYFASVGCPIRVMGVPKTIDNDLPLMDHTPGFGSAAKFIATSMAEIIRDATVYDLDSVLIVEIMGRDTGWLTASAALPRLCGESAPHLVYLPEAEFSVDAFVEDVKRIQKESRTVIVAVSEGVEIDAAGDFRSGKVDNFGHKYLSGVGKALEQIVTDRIGCKVRSVELNVLQRCAAHCASATDVCEAEQVGMAAVRAAVAGETGKVAAILRVSDAPYAAEYTCIPVGEVANKVKYVPREWIAAAGNDVTDEVLAYVRPLVEGEIPLLTECGMPRHFVIDR